MASVRWRAYTDAISAGENGCMCGIRAAAFDAGTFSPGDSQRLGRQYRRARERNDQLLNPSELKRLIEENHMSLGTILLIVLVLLLVGAIPTWPHSRSWGYGPTGGLGVVLIIVLVLLLMGRI